MAIQKFNYKSANGRMVFELAGTTVQGIFEELATIQEILEADSVCGACKSPDIYFRVRDVAKGNKSFRYHEMACHHCGARLAFGQRLEGKGLFPKRSDENGAWLANRGWAKYVPKAEDAA